MTLNTLFDDESSASGFPLPLVLTTFLSTFSHTTLFVRCCLPIVLMSGPQSTKLGENQIQSKLIEIENEKISILGPKAPFFSQNKGRDAALATAEGSKSRVCFYC